MQQADLLKHGAAEFVGTFTLIFVGAGSIIATQGNEPHRDRPGVPLAIGVMASAVGDISGGHLNPAWIYRAGPLIGAGIAALAYDRMYLRTLSLEPPGPPKTGLEEPRPGDAASI